MLSFLQLIYISQKKLQICKIRSFLSRKWVRLFISAQLFILAQLLCSLNNSKKKLYANISEMLRFNSKTRFQKYPISGMRYSPFSANVSDFLQVIYC
jgi:hypothetical protein